MDTKIYYTPIDPEIMELFGDMIFEMNVGADKHPVWPTDPIHRASIVLEEAGEVIRAANHIREGIGTAKELRQELLETAGTIYRMLLYMKDEIEIVDGK